jgi:hypothetical protein
MNTDFSSGGFYFCDQAGYTLMAGDICQVIDFNQPGCRIPQEIVGTGNEVIGYIDKGFALP